MGAKNIARLFARLSVLFTAALTACGEAGGVAANAGACGLLAYDPQLVGLGPAGDYAKYLKSDAGLSVGQCPSSRAFRSNPSEGACAYAVCGPLQPSAIPIHTGLDGGSSCCFWVVGVCGI